MSDTEKKIYSLDDVARELGVSKTTVSRAISGKGRIGGATRERVLQFIETHDYRPSAVARGLSQKKTYNIGLVFPTDYAVTELAFFKECMNGICEAASRRDYDVLVTMQDGSDLSNLRRMVINRKVDGVILSRAMEHSKAQQYLKESMLPFLVIGPTTDEQTISVDNRNSEGACAITGKMLEQGCVRLALFGGDRSHLVTRCRMDGYLQALEEKEILTDKELIFMDIKEREDVMRALEKVRSLGVDGIVCMDDHIASMTLDCLHKQRIQVPQELVLASMYDSPELEKSEPSVSAVKFDTVMLGRIACQRLMQLLGEEEEAINTSNFHLQMRDSTTIQDA